jgi:thiol-disulfide isomerase/thioredoxin
MELAIRLVAAVAIIVIGIAAYLIWTRLLLAALRRRVGQRAIPKGLDGLCQGIPAILYFTTPDCAPCRTIQIPAINALLEQYGDELQLIKIDATEKPDIAGFWGVLSVPTTFIIDAKGQPRRVNHGVAPAAKLRQQLREIGFTPVLQTQLMSSSSNVNAKSLDKISTCEEC